MKPDRQTLPELTAAQLAEAVGRFRLLTEEQKSYHLRHVAEVLASSPEWALELRALFKTLEKMKPSEQAQGLMLMSFALGLEAGRIAEQ